MSPLTGLLDVSHLQNPYAAIWPIGDPPPKDPDILPGHDLHRFPFTKPLNAAQQAQFTFHLTNFFHNRDYLNFYPAKARDYVGYCFTNPPFLQALITAATATPQFCAMPPSVGTSSNPLADEEPWLAAWPWLPEPLRAALRPHLPSIWRIKTQHLLALIDDQVASPPQSQYISEAVPPSLARWISRGTPISRTEWTDVLDHACRAQRLPMHIRTLLRWSDADQLDQVIGDPQRQRHRHAAYWCPMSRPTLIALALRDAPLPFTERNYWAHEISRLPWLAPIDPAVTLDQGPGRDLLLALGAWARLRPFDAPRLRISRTPAIMNTIRQEAQGPYADLAALIHQRLAPHPDTTNNDDQMPVVSFPTSHKETETLLKDPRTPLPVLAACLDVIMRDSAGSVPLAEALGAHPQTTEAFRDRLIAHPSQTLRHAVAGSPHLTHTQRDLLLGYGKAGIRIAILKNQTLSLADMEQLLLDPDDRIRAFLAEHPALPPSMIDVLIHDRSIKVRHALLQRHTVPSHLLEHLVTSPDRDDRVLAANHPTCSVEQLDRLSRDTSWLVLEAVAANPNTNQATVERLAAKSPTRLGEVLVTHPNLTEQTRVKLAIHRI